MEEEEICRVCRSEGTVEEPLFYPCKCSGSIRFVHQECLMEWLLHSKKKYCELCNHYYKFTPVYKNDMPTFIPKKIFLGHLKNMLCSIFKWSIRACLVCFIWLGLVPFITVWIWRFYFWNADTTKYLFNKYFLSTAQNSNNEASIVNEKETNIWKILMYDCLQGWLISSIVTVVFIAGFLLREWVIQNVPTELHDQEEEEEEEEEEIPDLIPPQFPHLQPIDVAPFQIQEEEDQEQIPRTRRGRINNPRRPPLRGEPSDYENLEAMWLMDEAQVSPPLHMLERDPFDLDQDSDDEEDDADGYFVESEEEEPVNPERVGEIFDTVRREQENQNIPDQIMNPIDENIQLQQQHHEDIPRNQENENIDNVANGVAGGPEDIDGILEAIGMEGSIYILFQNSGLMTLLMSLCLGVGVWLPYILGVFFITIRPWDGLVLLTYFMRYLSDSILDCISDLWLEFYIHLNPVSQCIPSWTPTIIKSFIISAVQIGQTLIKFFSTDGITDAYMEFFLFTTTTNTTTPSNTTTSFSSTILIDPATNTVQSYSVSLWHDLISFYNYMKPFCQSFFSHYIQMPTSDTAMDRVGCIVIGYIILVTIGSLYLSRTRSMYARIGLTARQLIRQLGILLKVAFFLVIEIAVFPVGCGFLLDYVSISLFYKIDGEGHLLAIHKRMTFLKENVTSSIFMHWVIGTGFMFLFKAMVTFCRDIVRPGVIWFIRDPNDPQFNPIEDLVKRPVFTNLKKIGASAVIYSFAIEFGVGGLIAAIGAIFDGFLPLKWSYIQPLTTIPVDLLVVMIVVPTMIEYFDPIQLMEKTMIQWTTLLCHELRLTSFLLGGRPINEEGYIYYKTWRAWIQRPELNNATLQEHGDGEENDLAMFIKSGLLVRAPKHDGVRYVPGRRMLVPVDPITLEALDPSERSLGHPATRSGQDEEQEEHTTIVYLPPQFKLRMGIFMFIMWISWSTLLCCVFVGPIAVGRWLFQYNGIVAQPGKKIHDIYAYFIGGCAMILVGVLVKKSKSVISKFSTFDFSHVLYIMNWAFNFTTIFMSFGIIIPIIFGCILQLYLIIPCQNLGSRAPVIDLFSIYVNGLVCLTLVDGIVSVIANQTLSQSLNRFKENGISRFNFSKEMKELIGPLIINGLLAIMLPFLILIIRNYFDHNTTNQVRCLQIIYPAVFIGLVLYYFSNAFTKFGKRWCQSVREDHYLVGRVLHNMDTTAS